VVQIKNLKQNATKSTFALYYLCVADFFYLSIIYNYWKQYWLEETKMKKIIVIILGAVMLFSLSACVFLGASGRQFGDYEVIFDRNGFVVFDDEHTSSAPVIFENRGQLDDYIQSIIANMGWLDEFPDHREEMSRHINEFYHRFDGAFFNTHRLVVAHIDSGSGSLRFGLNSLRQEGGSLVVSIDRYTPMVQTMDYNRFIMVLAIDRGFMDFDERG